MEIIVVAFFGALATVVVSLIGLYGARKVGLGPTQVQLVSNLKDLVDAQGKKITEMATEAREQNERIGELESQVDKLTRLTISQALMIEQLKSKKRIIIAENGADKAGE